MTYEEWNATAREIAATEASDDTAAQMGFARVVEFQNGDWIGINETTYPVRAYAVCLDDKVEEFDSREDAARALWLYDNE